MENKDRPPLPEFGFYPVVLYENFGAWLVKIKGSGNNRILVEKVRWLWGFDRWRPSDHNDVPRQILELHIDQLVLSVDELRSWFDHMVLQVLSSLRNNSKSVNRKIEELQSELFGIEEDADKLVKAEFPEEFVNALEKSKGATKEIKTKQELDEAWNSFSTKV